MDIVSLYRDYNIYHATEGHKHCRPGWVNVECPFCTGNPGLHLGATLDGSHFYCWRCGWHPAGLSLSKLLHIPLITVNVVIKQYGGVSVVDTVAPIIGEKEHKYPTGVADLQKSHIKYLEKRNFDPDKLVKLWKLQGTGPVAKLDGIDYSRRIMIPIHWEGQQVTFQARDITGKKELGLKYLACPKQREAIHHKHMLYGKQEYWGWTGICTEGVTDVWRFGPYSVCTFGIEYKIQQVRMLASNFKRIAVAFDDDPQAIRQAEKLVAELQFRGVDAFRVHIVGDPGAMPQSEADYLVKQIIGKYATIKK